MCVNLLFAPQTVCGPYFSIMMTIMIVVSILGVRKERLSKGLPRVGGRWCRPNSPHSAGFFHSWRRLVSLDVFVFIARTSNSAILSSGARTAGVCRADRRAFRVSGKHPWGFRAKHPKCDKWGASRVPDYVRDYPSFQVLPGLGTCLMAVCNDGRFEHGLGDTVPKHYLSIDQSPVSLPCGAF